MTVQLPIDRWQRWSTATGVLMSASSIRRCVLHRGLRARVPLYRIPLTQTIDGCVCNGLMSTEPGIPGAIFQHDNARPHVAKNVRDFCSAQHMQLFLWPAYWPDMSRIEHMWDLVGQLLTRDPRRAASKDELLLRIQAIWNSLPQADLQNLFEFMPRHIAAGPVLGLSKPGPFPGRQP
ncbi:transposable element Tcb1 transposase [Trichonephila clavipes]|nr:transposable element Tcb1 transposase [Trichonephila clavipes]